MSTIESKEYCRTAEILWVVSDNGGGYSHEIAALQYYLYELFVNNAHALLICCAYGTGDSKRNWEVESMWVQARRRTVGKEFGRSSVSDIHRSFAGFDNTEDALAAISDAAMDEFSRQLAMCKVAGEPWSIRSPMEHTIKDYAVVSAAFQLGAKQLAKPQHAPTLSKIKSMYAHLEKTPSFIQFRMCVKDHFDVCKAGIAKRRAQQADWNPATVLKPLMWNNGWFPFPQFREPAILADVMKKAVLASLAGDAPAQDVADVEPSPQEQPFVQELEGFQKELEEAVAQEDFLLCGKLKQRRVFVEQQLGMIRREQERHSFPQVYSLPTTAEDCWAVHDHSPYLSWTEMRESVEPQSKIFIPVDVSKPHDKVLPCPRAGCRYVSKSATELARHTLLTHTKACVAKAAASADCPPAGRILPGDYSVVGMQPKCKPRPPHKAKAKSAPLDPDAPLEGDAEVEGVESGAVEADVGDESMLWEEEELPDAVEAATEKDLGVEASVPAKKKAEESLGGPVKKPAS